MHPNARAGNAKAYNGTRATRTQVNGVWYDSMLEARMATVLHKHGVQFCPHHTIEWTDRRTKTNQKWCVDFSFPRPVRFRGMNTYIDVLEVTGPITDEKVQRIASLEDVKPVNVWLATPSWVEFWEKFGLL